MKPCGCSFCNDLRYIEPAKYIVGGDDDFKEFIEKAKKNKRFIYNYYEEDDDGKSYHTFITIDECPKCGYVFTEEDYDWY